MLKLRIYEVALEIVEVVEGLSRRIGRRSPHLADQIGRASESMVLTMSEGQYSRGKNQAALLQRSMASAAETRTAIQIALRKRLLSSSDAADVLDKLDHVVATLWKLVHR